MTNIIRYQRTGKYNQQYLYTSQQQIYRQSLLCKQTITKENI